MAQLLPDALDAPLGEAVWQDTRLHVPGMAPQQGWRNIFTDEPVRFTTVDDQPTLVVAELLAHFPVALLMAPEATGHRPEQRTVERQLSEAP